jgi:hypothetical protein
VIAAAERSQAFTARAHEGPAAPFSPFTLSDRRARYLLNAVVERCGLIVGHSGNRVHVRCTPTDYVIPGVLIAVSDGAHANHVWMGVNERRLFYIQRFQLALSDVERLFHFCFGGAEKVGWSFSFESIGDEEVSVWGTAWPEAPFTDATDSTIREETGLVAPLLRLTAEGTFWVNDVAMMLQSSFRVAQRHGVRDGASPCPL